MTAKTYWILKYVDEPIRNEPKNIGVVLSFEGRLQAKFLGERDDYSLDGRSVRAFRYPDVYAQWHTFWRKQIAKSDLAAILDATTANFYAATGGEVAGTGSDSASDVCAFLFSMLVSRGGAEEAFDLGSDEKTEMKLAEDILDALRAERILESAEHLLAPHPIVEQRTVPGRRTPHRPSFSQQNGLLYVIEHIDLAKTKPKTVIERAGWMAYMFDDIRDVERSVQAISVVRPMVDEPSDATIFAGKVLADASVVVDWSNADERRRFLLERRSVALSLA